MFESGIPQVITPRERRLAYLIAIAADAIQIVALPFFAEGGFSPFDTFIDIAVAVMLTRLLGWHWAFLPAVLAELVPGLDLFPTWIAAVFYVTRQRTLVDDSRLDVESEPFPPGPPKVLHRLDR
jgi:hypothetical protein